MSIRRSIGMEEAVCILLLGFFAMQGAIPGISPNQATEMTNSAATGLMKTVGIGSQIVVDGIICMLAAIHWRRLYDFVFSLQWAAVLALFAVLSTCWSQDSATTARRSIPFILATAFGLYLASRFSVRQQTAIVCATMVVAALTSIVLVFLAPGIGLEASTGHFGNWQGVFTQKNACGRAMVFASAALLAKGRINVMRSLCFMLFLLVLVMSGSRGAWAIEAALLTCYSAFHGLTRFRSSSRTLLLYSGIILTVLMTVAMWICFPLLTLMVGRDATLSGRTAIWQQVWSAILKHPLLGYGFSAFWQGMKGESYHVVLALRFVIFHAHNGFLEIWLELGACGLFLFLLSYFRAWRKLWWILHSAGGADASWMLFVLILIALYDIEENSLLTFNGLFWILYVAALANIEILTAERRYQHRAYLHWISRQQSAMAASATQG